MTREIPELMDQVLPPEVTMVPEGEPLTVVQDGEGAK